MGTLSIISEESLTFNILDSNRRVTNIITIGLYVNILLIWNIYSYIYIYIYIKNVILN